MKELVQEMRVWQKENYLHREIWESNIFSRNLLADQSSVVQDKSESHSPNSAISDQERMAFKQEDLDPEKWVPKLCKYFNIENMKLLKDVGRDRIAGFLNRIKNTTTREALRVLLRELRCLHVPSFELKTLTDLPDVMNKRMRYLTLNRDDDGIKCEEMVDQLECTIWKWHNSSESSYEFLTFLATLSLFDFSLKELIFNNSVQEKDIQNLSTTLRRNLDELKKLKTIMDKQAFVLNIALSNPFEKTEVLHYILGKLPNKISRKFSGCTGQNFNLLKLQEAVKQLITRKYDKVLEEKQKSLSMHFNSIFSRKISIIPAEAENGEVKKSVKTLLENLGLMEYYPQKLSYGDVIKVTENACNETDEKPSLLQELPWFFLRRLIGLNSTIREKGSVIVKRNVRKRKRSPVMTKKMEGKGRKKRKLNFSWNDDSEEEDTGDQYISSKHESEKEDTESVINSIHPLDLIYIIFLCADDFLRQELADKMSKCQYAVPFILPSAIDKGDESMNTVLHWGLQTISRTYCEEKGSVVTKNVLGVSCPIVSFLSINTNTTWKSKILNKMLSPQQDTFWHEGLEGGNRTQRVSQGMVEVSWYLPAGRGHDEFKAPVTFTNLRGDANQFPVVTETLCKLSTSTCVFTDKINKDVLAFLEKYFGEKHLKKLILVILFCPAHETNHVKSSKKLKEQLDLDDCHIICRPSEDSSFHTTYEILKKSLRTCIDETTDIGTSILQFINDVKSSACMKVDDVACWDGYNAARGILEEIAGMESDKVKSDILPCQSDLATREEIGRHEKEICRQKYIGESDLITQYMARKEEEKWQLQWKQLQYPISDTFTRFLQYVRSFSSIKRKYFLQSLKLGLNERSTELLQPLYEDYEKYRLEEKSPETDRKLRELNEHLTYSSLGLEHFFREMAVMYENMAALRKKLGPKKYLLDDVLEKLSETMADIVLEGDAMEILDGDAVHSPVLWLKAVLTQIERRGEIRIFKVSALGAQSSGKSTLLNTVFGLNFPVSSGRCTRGAYMQLVKIDENFAKRLKCDYLLVIDSEGLMSRVSKNDDYDNELATFVIGLSDLTLVVIKGEGNEMQDVLPIAIHVFLRMNVLGELQACHFVHQNMGAVDVKKTMPVEIDTFVQLLDEKTRAAAQEAWKKKYTRFADVLHYDKNKDNTYVSGLWDGSPPMGKTDLEYSNTMQRLKGNILERLENVATKKHCSTLGDFSKWLESIWEAVKYENFVFSFRNVLAVEAYKRLSRILNDKEWKIKRIMRDNMDKKTKEIKSKITTIAQKDSCTAMKTIEQMTEKADENITDYVRVSIKELLTCIRHYFQCPGCQEKDCDEEVRNRQFLRDYKGEFEHDIVRFMRALEEEISQSIKNLVVELSSHEDNAKMDKILKKKVRKVIDKAKSLTEKEKKKIFDDMWETETEEIVRKYPQKKTSANHIKTTVQNTIKASLGPDDFRYIQKKADISNEIGNKDFTFKQEHVNGGQKLAPHILRCLRRRTETIVKRAGLHYRKIEKGRKFEQKHAETLFKDIQNRIERIKHEGIETTLDYKVDLMMHIGELAVRDFSLNQTAYEEYRCPRRLLRKKRDAYYEIFLIATGLGNPAVEFGNIICKVTEENLEDRVTCTGLLNTLRIYGDIFRSAESLITSSITDLMKDRFREHKLPLVQFETMIKDTIRKKCISCLEEKDRLQCIAKAKLFTVIGEMKDATEKTLYSNCKSKDFIGTLFAAMNGLRKPHNDIETYKMVTIDDKVQFAETLIAQLTGPIYEQLQNKIDSWDVARIIERKGFPEFAFKEIVGCLICSIKYRPYMDRLIDRSQNYQIQLEHLAESREEEILRSYNCKAGHVSGTYHVKIREGHFNVRRWLNWDDENDDTDVDRYLYGHDEQSVLSHFDFLNKISL